MGLAESVMRRSGLFLVILSGAALSATAAGAQDGPFGWMKGDWYLTVGATGMAMPKFDGSKDYMFRASPIISLGKAGPEARFTSRNDNISLSLIDDGNIRAGVTGKLIFGRDDDDASELEGWGEIPFGGEAGVFMEFYPTDWMRLRAEVRHGIESHGGVVGDLSVDAFRDVTETIRISGGPRLSMASSDFFEAYYGLDAAEAVVAGISPYSPDGGLKSLGVGGAVTWKTTDKLTTSLFGEYARLMGPAADSSLVREAGSRNQFTVGVSAAYRFDFKID